MKATKPKRVATATVAAQVAAPARPLIWPYIAAAVLAVFAVFEVYGPALHGPFLYDDTTMPYLLPQYVDAPLKPWIAGLRPLLMFSFWLNFRAVGSNDSYPYHVVNVLLHLFNGVFVYLIVRKVLSWTGKADRLLRELLAAFGAGLFLLHPVQTESVSYVASRSETLSVFFVLAAFVAFLYRKTQAISVAWAGLVLLLYGAAVLSKEDAVALLAVLVLTDYYWNPGFSTQGIRRNWKLYVPSLIAAGLGVGFVFGILRRASTAGFNVKDFTWYQYFFTECRAIWEYFRLFFLPFGQNLDYDFPISKTILDHGAIIGLLALIALIAAAWVYRKRFPLISYGVLTTLIFLAPTSSVVPIQDPMVERRMYLPFIGLVFIAVGLISLWRAKMSTLVVALSAVLLVEAFLTVQRNQLYADAVAIWRDTATKSPNKVRPLFQLAMAEYYQGHCPEAVDDFAKAARLEKPDYSLLIDWGLAYDCAGNSSAAISKLEESAAMQPSAHVYSQIAREYGKIGQYAQALDVLEKAAKLDPNFEMIYVYRGDIYSSMNKPDLAAEAYRRALAIDPHYDYARTRLSQLGR